MSELLFDTLPVPPPPEPTRGRIFANKLRKLAHKFDTDHDVPSEAIDLLMLLEESRK